MGEKFHIYVRDDELCEWVKKNVDIGNYRNLSHAFEEGLKLLRARKSKSF